MVKKSKRTSPLGRSGTSTAACVRRILAVWARATPSDIEAGARWYGDGEVLIDSMAVAVGRSREHVAAVIAQLSPRTRWERNVAGAASLLLGGDAPSCLRANVARARVALASENPIATIRGQKTSAFAVNLLGDRSSVTIDVWAARVALGERDDLDLVLGRVGVYDALANAYRIAARRVGVDVVTAQAVCWIVSRNGRAG